MECHDHVKKPLLVDSQYFPSIHYFLLLMQHGEIYVDGHENMAKASYRNRCHIASPDGQLALTVPLEHGRHQRRAVKDVVIFNELDWQKKHWDTLCSAYRRSPYFEYYEDSLYAVFYKPYSNLLLLNTDMLNWVIAKLKLEIKYEFTTRYNDNKDGSYHDWRGRIQPNEGKSLSPIDTQQDHYHQVFEDRLGFLPNLSILDLLFALGPRSVEYLNNSISKCDHS